jgi:hypothetical protein
MALSGAERQAAYIARLKARAAYADVLAARNAELEAQVRSCARAALIRSRQKP